MPSSGRLLRQSNPAAKNATKDSPVIQPNSKFTGIDFSARSNTARRKPHSMSKQASEHHHQAAEHHEKAAHHHREAVKP